MEGMTAEPSPTAAATRFIDPSPMSPAANTPSTEVSYGRRGRPVPGGTAKSVSTNPSSSRATSSGNHLLEGRAPMKQKSPTAASRLVLPRRGVPESHGFELLAAVNCLDDRGRGRVDARVRGHAVNQVLRHRCRE